MTKESKRYIKAKGMVDVEKMYSVEEAVGILAQFPKTKFNETVDLSVSLNVDPKHADQLVRGTVVLPHGTGKTVRVVAFTQGDKAKEAQDAGADIVGFKDLVEKIKGGWADFDVAVATPDTMGEVGKLGKVLGPKGLMPSPKSGTVTQNIAQAIKEVKAGRVEFKVDKDGNLHMIVGKSSFAKEKLLENINTAIDSVLSARPAAVKGHYIKSMSLSATMSPGVRLDHTRFGVKS
jgi:large subunit ribosomal protein L1